MDLGCQRKTNVLKVFKFLSFPLFLTYLVFKSTYVLAESDRPDYDLDNDGLIEINDVADLHEIRNYLDGAALYGSSEGCPVDGCNGFELTTDLDLDVDGSGEIEESEEWISLASSETPFTAVFNGNHYEIRNLTSNSYGFRGLFGYLLEARVENLFLENLQAKRGLSSLAFSASETIVSEVVVRGSVVSYGSNSVAGLITRVSSNSLIERSVFEGKVQGYNFISGFVVEVDATSTIRNSFVSGVVIGRSSQALGGFVAFVREGAVIENSYSVARVDIPFGGGKDGFAGNLWDKVIESKSYWDTEASTAPNSLIGQGYSTEELVCPISGSNTSCANDGGIIYDNWSDSVWDFGSDKEYPGLIINNQVIRPMVIDSDSDGVADYVDAFDEFAGASVDADGDGIADDCHIGFESECITKFGIDSDTHLNDTDNDGVSNDVSLDDDGDGVDDATDVFPLNANETVDTDGDGIGDNSDYDDDGNGLIEIRQVSDLDIIRFLSDKFFQYAGCEKIICRGFELTSDIDFDTNGSGSFDVGDSYWNEGLGWEPLSVEDDIVLRIEGNNFTIKNLYIDRIGQVGLVSSIDIGYISKLKIEGKVSGTSRAGLVVGYARATTLEEVLGVGSVSSTSDSVGGLIGNSFVGNIRQSAFMGTVTGDESVGGLLGSNHNTDISDSFSSGVITGNNRVGGLTGYRYDDHGDTRNSYSVAKVVGSGSFSRVGGLIGEIRSGDDIDVYESYWDSRNTPSGLYGNSLTTEIMICPQGPSDLNCSVTPLVYENWDGEKWDFGSELEYPAIKMERGLIRPNLLDTDSDSQPDYLDAFPENPAATLDADFDGMPESWALGCEIDCQESSGLVIDPRPNDTDNDGQKNDVDDDIDNDGALNVSDGMPYDPTEISDIDGDGIGDNRDVDDNNNNLIDITTLSQLQAFGVSLDPNALTEKQEGCPAGTCLGIELLNDLDFDIDGNGVIDVHDGEGLWNEGKGWKPIGSYENRFRGVFEGNGFSINNFYINRPTETYTALIAATHEADIRNVRIAGNVNGRHRAALLVGFAEQGAFTNIVVEGRINSDGTSGGLIGENLWFTEIRKVFADVYVSATNYAGGIIGRDQHGNIYDSLVQGVIKSATQPAGGLTGTIWGTDIHNSLSLASLFSQTRFSAENRIHGHLGGYGSFDDGDLINSYWAHDVTGLQGDENSATLAQLKCPTAVSDINCASIILYQNWDNDIWDLGSSDQLPALVIGSVKYSPEIIDTDGDLYPDQFDAAPNNPAVADDFDGDGYPDSWAYTCDSICQENSGVILDEFPNDSNEWVDTDGDSVGNNLDTDDDDDGVLDTDDLFPLDQTESSDFDGDLIGDNADTDDDNDGVEDILDAELGVDNGLPVITAIPADMHLSVTSDNGYSAKFNMDVSQVTATDVFDEDSSLSIIARWENNRLEIDAEGEAQLPAGKQIILWIAIDQAGNESVAVEQIINIYPRVRFDRPSSIIGEGTDAKVDVRLTGDSPIYPVTVNLRINGLSDANQDDLDPLFDTSTVHQLTIEKGENALSLNRTASFSVPVVQDNLDEVDELLLVDLTGVVEENENSYFSLQSSHQQHSLTITEQNFAPEVQLVLEQNGNEVANVVNQAGPVSIKALVSDVNGSDNHIFEWNLGSLPLNAPVGSNLNFDPAHIAVDEYPLEVIVTDDGYGALSGSASAVLHLVEWSDVVEEPVMAPALQLILMQDGKQVANIQKEGGLVTIKAIVNDEDNELTWSLDSLGLNAPNDLELDFDPINLPTGVYSIEVKVTDSRNLTTTQSMTISIVSTNEGRGGDPIDEEEATGGSIYWFLLLMLSIGLVRTRPQ